MNIILKMKSLHLYKSWGLKVKYLYKKVIVKIIHRTKIFFLHSVLHTFSSIIPKKKTRFDRNDTIVDKTDNYPSNTTFFCRLRSNNGGRSIVNKQSCNYTNWNWTGSIWKRSLRSFISFRTRFHILGCFLLCFVIGIALRFCVFL